MVNLFIFFTLIINNYRQENIHLPLYLFFKSNLASIFISFIEREIFLIGYAVDQTYTIFVIN